MERLTKRNKGWIDIDPKNNGEGTVERCIQRLAAYEDTGLTVERAAELAQAKRDNRLVELPCKYGEQIFTLRVDVSCRDKPCQHHCWPVEARQRKLCAHVPTVISVPFDLFFLNTKDMRLKDGYYLTRPEAEAALRRQKEGAK